MADVINLRQARKTRARAEKEQTAQQRRALFGRTKAQRQLDEQQASKDRSQLDGKKLDQD